MDKSYLKKLAQYGVAMEGTPSISLFQEIVSEAVARLADAVLELDQEIWIQAPENKVSTHGRHLRFLFEDLDEDQLHVYPSAAFAESVVFEILGADEGQAMVYLDQAGIAALIEYLQNVQL